MLVTSSEDEEMSLGPHPLLEVKWLPEGCVFSHLLKLKNEVRLFLNI